MPTDLFRVLSGTDKMFYPADGLCPVCGGGLQGGFAYLSGGAVLSPDGGQGGRLQGFLQLGFHGSDPEMRDSSDVTVVEDLEGGQFDLHWCSVGCMREWMLRLLAEVERRIAPERA